MTKKDSIDRASIGDDDWLAKAGNARGKINSKLGEVEEVERITEILQPAFDQTKPFFKRLKAFIKAQKQLRKWFFIIIDIWGFFNPKVKKVEDYIRKHIIPKL